MASRALSAGVERQVRAIRSSDPELLEVAAGLVAVARFAARTLDRDPAARGAWSLMQQHRAALTQLTALAERRRADREAAEAAQVRSFDSALAAMVEAERADA